MCFCGAKHYNLVFKIQIYPFTVKPNQIWRHIVFVMWAMICNLAIRSFLFFFFFCQSQKIQNNSRFLCLRFGIAPRRRRGCEGPMRGFVYYASCLEGEVIFLTSPVSAGIL